MSEIFLNTDINNPTKHFVLMEDDIEKVVAIIEAPYKADCLAKIAQAVKEDMCAHDVRVTTQIDKESTPNFFFIIEVQDEEGDEWDSRDYSLYLTAKY